MGLRPQDRPVLVLIFVLQGFPDHNLADALHRSATHHLNWHRPLQMEAGVQDTSRLK